MVELALDRRQVLEDVGVVVFEVVQDRGARPVVDELAALVEEGGVVFVGLDDEWRLAAGSAGARRDTEVARYAADEKARCEAGRFQDPREHRGRRGLAVRAGDREHVAPRQHLVGEPLRAAGVGRAGVEDRFHQRVAADDRVADDVEIRCERELLGAVAFDQVDAERAQLLAHRRVDVGVAAGHRVAAFARQRRDASHEGAADAEDVEVHRKGLAGAKGSGAPMRAWAVPAKAFCATRRSARLAAAAAIVASMSAAVCAELTKPAS